MTRRIARLAAALCLTAAAQAASAAGAKPATDHGAPAPTHTQENPAMPATPQSSRPAPPEVAPVEYQGVRYEQDMDSYAHGGDQPGGYLAAIDIKTGQRLWLLKVYELEDHSAAGVDNIGVYFTRMTLVPGRDALEIENETGGRFVVDLVQKTSTPLDRPAPSSLPPIKIPQ